MTRIRFALVLAVLPATLIIASAQAASVAPVYYAGNPSCATLDPTWTETKLEPVPKGKTTANGDGNVTTDQDGRYFDWTSNTALAAVIVKGGDNANVYFYDPNSKGDTGLHAPINDGNGGPYGLSHISFCVDPTPNEQPPGENPPCANPPCENPPGENPPGQNPPGGQNPTVTPGANPTTTPEGGVLGGQARSGRATLKAATGCAKTTYLAKVRGVQIAKVTWRLDGRKAGSGKTKRIDTSTLRNGVHVLVAKVTFKKASRTAAKTYRRTFQRCARAAVAPAFTG